MRPLVAQHELNLQQHFIQISEEAVYWKTLSSSSFFLYAKRTMVKIEEELLVFDFEDLVNGLGGALGLFLGWSLLQILLQSFTFFHQIISWATKKCNIKSVSEGKNNLQQCKMSIHDSHSTLKHKKALSRVDLVFVIILHEYSLYLSISYRIQKCCR